MTPLPRKHDLWEEAISKLGLDISRPVNYLTATELKLAIHQEPRLMASMDSEAALPEFLRRNGLFVLPVSRNRYAVVRGNGYHTLENPGPVEEFTVNLPIPLTSLAYGRGESRYLLHAYHSNLLSAFTGVAQLFPTVSGKQASGTFGFRLDGTASLEVSRAGMEVDFGFEGPDDLLLLEAKAVDRLTFLVRQLYYPYRTYREVTSKHVRPIFFMADPEAQVYTVWEYEWSDPDDYEAIRLRKTRRYHLVEGRPQTARLVSVASDPALLKVPQADDFAKVAELPFLVQSGVQTTSAWNRLKGLTPRQGQYYPQAGEALGLIRSVGRRLELTEDGLRYIQMSPAERDGMLAELILRNPLMNAVLHLVLDRGAKGVGDDDVAEIIRRMSTLTGSTPLRRAKSIRSYFRWLSQATGAVVVDQQRIYGREGWEQRSEHGKT